MQTLRPTRVGGPLRVARPALAAFGAMGICWGAFAAALPDTKALLGVDEARLGLMMLFAPVAAMAAMLTAARLGSALGRRALPLMVLAMGAAFVLPGQSPALWAFAAAMILCGAATGALDVLMNARVTALEAERGLPLMNLCHAVYSLAYAAAAIGTGLARGAGLGPGAILGGAAVAAMLASLMAFERDGTIHGLARPPRGSAALGAAPFIGGAMVMIAFLSENAAEAWSALHIERTLGGSATEGSLGPALLAITMGLARLAGQGLLARVAPATLLSAGALVAGLGALVAAFALSPAMAYAGFVIMGLGASVIAPTAFSMVGQAARPEARARAVARATFLGYLGYFFGPPTLGFLAAAFGLRAAFAFAALALLSVLVLAPLMARRG
ncbi:Major Facilitator Superfamily protein [[Luteovulum] sphaeroides subsp. megalophilum]|uniref:MFS transporter n=1 Tax=Cereibacter sphaeroides TaxID=1063 RepID=UPI000B6D9CB7|nr:MFS transporter [Cereibacter sphaeroides]AZB62748.1 MFS transporter [Cereibacter sphaeroides]AZB69295.1 MFS transporter [Cereibacter sphaeroides]RIA01249.1 MFS transporter [Cereibacter sphaeroides]SNS56605.1 Major Facilitator Superfamily protein [[Luteovulum] sphaeroides subsp. megalophilum]